MNVDFAANVAANVMFGSVVEVIESSIYIEVLGLYLISTTDEKELQNSGIRKHCPTRKVRKGENLTLQEEERLYGHHPLILGPAERC